MDNNKFNVSVCGSIELAVGESIDVLKKVQGEGWVVERKLLNMMALINNNSRPESFDTLHQLETRRPEWGGVLLSVFDESTAQAH